MTRLLPRCPTNTPLSFPARLCDAFVIATGCGAAILILWMLPSAWWPTFEDTHGEEVKSEMPGIAVWIFLCFVAIVTNVLGGGVSIFNALKNGVEVTSLRHVTKVFYALGLVFVASFFLTHFIIFFLMAKSREVAPKWCPKMKVFFAVMALEGVGGVAALAGAVWEERRQTDPMRRILTHYQNHIDEERESTETNGAVTIDCIAMTTTDDLATSRTASTRTGSVYV